MINTQELAHRYIASWNETDAAARQRLIDVLWTEDGQYADPIAEADGRNGIAALIAGVQTQFPGHRFTLTGHPDGHGPYIRFTWALGPSDGPVIARGTDFAAVSADGRFSRVTGFLDQMPSAA